MATDQSPLKEPPKGYDKDWREKIERAKEEREATIKARAAKSETAQKRRNQFVQ